MQLAALVPLLLAAPAFVGARAADAAISGSSCMRGVRLLSIQEESRGTVCQQPSNIMILLHEAVPARFSSASELFIRFLPLR
eukprot:SAG31_NODE_810_length_11919_cov_4.480924_6_plen_82_part_00